MARRLIAVAGLAILGLAGSGCGTMMVQQTYEGARLPPTEVALVQAEDVSGFMGGNDHPTTQILSFDGGKDMAYMKSKLEFLPGDHTVMFKAQESYQEPQYSGQNMYYVTKWADKAYFSLEFTAEPGRIYETRARKTHSLAYQNKTKDKGLLGSIAVGLKDGIEWDYEGQIYDTTTKKVVASQVVTKTE